jgi:hypothetical protein
MTGVADVLPRRRGGAKDREVISWRNPRALRLRGKTKVIPRYLPNWKPVYRKIKIRSHNNPHILYNLRVFTLTLRSTQILIYGNENCHCLHPACFACRYHIYRSTNQSTSRHRPCQCQCSPPDKGIQCQRSRSECTCNQIQLF